VVLVERIEKKMEERGSVGAVAGREEGVRFGTRHTAEGTGGGVQPDWKAVGGQNGLAAAHAGALLAPNRGARVADKWAQGHSNSGGGLNWIRIQIQTNFKQIQFISNFD
jgi:hypothetical protein